MTIYTHRATGLYYRKVLGKYYICTIQGIPYSKARKLRIFSGMKTGFTKHKVL